MIKNKHLLLSVLLLLLGHACYAESKPIDIKDNREKELMRIALIIKEAIKKKETRTLLSFVSKRKGVQTVEGTYIPFKKVKNDLTNTNSLTYCLIFDTNCLLKHYPKYGTAISSLCEEKIMSIMEYFIRYDNEIEIKVSLFRSMDVGLVFYRHKCNSGKDFEEAVTTLYRVNKSKWYFVYLDLFE